MNTPVDRALDAMYCDRWSMVGTTEPSNVASHSFNVAIIAMALRKKMYNTLSYSEEEVCYYAIVHDIKEVYTGDLPTPTKAKMRAAGFDPDNFDPEVPDEKAPTDVVKSIVKMADLIDNYIFISEHGQGSRARSALSEVSGRLSAAVAGASPDLQRAAIYVIDYIKERKSESNEERERLAQEAERLRMFTHFSRTPGTPYVGGKSQHGVGGS